MRLPGGQAGFTLVELTVAMAILLGVVATLTSALVSASNTQADENNRFQTQSQARLALAKLTREIHCASQILDSSTGNELGATPVRGITLTLPAGCPTGGATAVTARWCAVPNGTRFDLYRSVGASCDSTTPCPGASCVRWGESLLSGTPFSLPSVAPSGDHFPLVHVDLTVNTRTSGSGGTYELTNDIAALNSVRSS